MKQFSSLRSRAGFTMFDVMVSAAIMTVISGAVFIGAMTLQRSFRAAQHYVRSQTAQMRVLDFVALDLRRALEVDCSKPGEVNIIIPDYYDNSDPANPRPRTPTIDGENQIQYGNAAGIRVRYYTVNSNLYREFGGVSTMLVPDVEDFLSKDFTASYFDEDEKRQSIKAEVTFVPKFQLSGDTSGLKNGSASHVVTLLRNKRRDVVVPENEYN